MMVSKLTISEDVVIVVVVVCNGEDDNTVLSLPSFSRRSNRDLTVDILSRLESIVLPFSPLFLVTI